MNTRKEKNVCSEQFHAFDSKRTDGQNCYLLKKMLNLSDISLNQNMHDG